MHEVIDNNHFAIQIYVYSASGQVAYLVSCEPVVSGLM